MWKMTSLSLNNNIYKYIRGGKNGERRVVSLPNLYVIKQLSLGQTTEMIDVISTIGVIEKKHTNMGRRPNSCEKNFLSTEPAFQKSVFRKIKNLLFF